MRLLPNGPAIPDELLVARQILLLNSACNPEIPLAIVCNLSNSLRPSSFRSAVQRPFTSNTFKELEALPAEAAREKDGEQLKLLEFELGKRDEKFEAACPPGKGIRSVARVLRAKGSSRWGNTSEPRHQEEWPRATDSEAINNRVAVRQMRGRTNMTSGATANI